MGFWDVTRNLLTGKPGFEEPTQPHDEWDDTPSTDYADERAEKRIETEEAKSLGLHDEHGVKHAPVVSIERTRYIMSGANHQVWGRIENHSSRVEELDRIEILGKRHDLDYKLQPGQQREFMLYDGPRQKHHDYHKAGLFYKDFETGDYFRADHLIEYKYETDGTYSVNELKPLLPVVDV